MKGLIFTFLVLFISNSSTFCQSDSVESSSDTIVSIDNMRHSPKKAALLSLAVPGLGQAYNKKAWKIPIIYAGFAGLSYAIYFNSSRHRCYKDAYRLQVNGDPSGSCNGVTNSANLQTLRDFYRRNLDLSVLGTVLWYGLQIVDATVDAHLYEFRFSDGQVLRLDPSLQFDANLEPTPGLKLSLQL